MRIKKTKKLRRRELRHKANRVNMWANQAADKMRDSIDEEIIEIIFREAKLC